LNNLEYEVLKFIKQNNLLIKDETPIVAVSGGIDSVCLLYVVESLKKSLNIKDPIVAHFNHKLRGKESSREEEFVKKISHGLGLRFITQAVSIKELARVEKTSIQQTARKYRLKFLEEVSSKYKNSKILTGHNKDDLAETTLMWVTRGTGLKGAVGILPKRGNFVRPLLNITREDIKDYTSKKGIIHIEDSSNSKLDYIRNRFRHEVVPLIEATCYPKAKDNIARFSSLIKDDLIYLENKAHKVFETITSTDVHGNINIQISNIVNIPRAIKTRVIRFMIKEKLGNLENISLSHIESIIELIEKKDDGNKIITLPKNIEAIKSYNKLIIRKTKSEKNKLKDSSKEYILNFPGTTTIEDLNIKIDLEVLPGGKSAETYKQIDPYLSFLNMDNINFPLRIRLPKKGDKFNPLGSKGTKKLSDFFIDNKVSVDERWKTPLLCDEKNIIWICGYRMSEKYRVSIRSNNVLMAKLIWI
jgi:tRNA(Ile)-lysidine synthase